MNSQNELFSVEENKLGKAKSYSTVTTSPYLLVAVFRFRKFESLPSDFKYIFISSAIISCCCDLWYKSEYELYLSSVQQFFQKIIIIKMIKQINCCWTFLGASGFGAGGGGVSTTELDTGVSSKT